MTRGAVLKYAIAFALRGASKVVRGLKQGLTETERHAVADQVVRQLKERGDPWHLGDEAKRSDAPTTTPKITVMDERYIATALAVLYAAVLV